MKNILLSICCCLAIMQAEDIVEKKSVEMETVSNSFTLGASISNFNSTSHETLYIPQGYASAGRKISELTWEAKNIKLLGINAAYDFNNGLGVYVDYKKNITTGNGVMDDLDWVDNANPDVLTHWSHHNNTDVDNVSILDLGLKYGYNFTDLSMETVSSINTWVSIGYRYENQKFSAYDGNGVYLGFPVVFSGLGITYEQEYKGPYIGIGADLKNKNILLNLGFKYSPMMSTEYQDRHHQRVPAFTEKSNLDETDMINFNIGLGYIIDKSQTISLSYEYTKYDYIRGNRTRYFDNGTVGGWDNSAAVDSKNSMINLKYSYIF